jgi:cation diffusion facilitator CzcD-associated flavoprotein CzcO
MTHPNQTPAPNTGANTAPAPRHVPFVIVGDGQAGLSVSRHLCAKGVGHVVLEEQEKFHSRRVNRWDSFCPGDPELAAPPAGLSR